MFLARSDTYFLEVRAHVSLKVATKGSLEVKNLTFLGYFYKMKTEDYDQSKLLFSYNFGTFIPSSVT